MKSELPRQQRNPLSERMKDDEKTQDRSRILIDDKLFKCGVKGTQPMNQEAKDQSSESGMAETIAPGVM